MPPPYVKLRVGQRMASTVEPPRRREPVRPSPCEWFGHEGLVGPSSEDQTKLIPKGVALVATASIQPGALQFLAAAGSLNLIL